MSAIRKREKEIAGLRETIREDRADYERWKSEDIDTRDRLHVALKACHETIAEARKANESLDAERNFLKARIECLEVTIAVLARLHTEANRDWNEQHDWRTKPKPVESGCAKTPESRW